MKAEGERSERKHPSNQEFDLKTTAADRTVDFHLVVSLTINQGGRKESRSFIAPSVKRQIKRGKTSTTCVL